MCSGCVWKGLGHVSSPETISGIVSVCQHYSRTPPSRFCLRIWAANVFPGRRLARRRQASKVNMLTNFFVIMKKDRKSFRRAFYGLFWFIFFLSFLLYSVAVRIWYTIRWKHWKLVKSCRVTVKYGERTNKQTILRRMCHQSLHFGFCICLPYRNMYSAYGVIASSLIFIHFQ